jgi:riboflavin biosynthesis pyrimidine reductase
LWPAPDPAGDHGIRPAGELTDEQLVEAYAPTDRAVPMIRVNMISSLDGAGSLHGRSGGLGNAVDQAMMARLRRLADVVVIGAGTIRAEGYGPVLLSQENQAWRVAYGLAAHPRMAIVTRSLELDPALFEDPPARPILITEAQAAERLGNRFGDRAEVIVCGDGAVDLAAMRAALMTRGLTQILCEGGPHLLGQLTTARLVDELCLTLSPLLAGPGAGRITAGEPTPPARMRLVHVLADEDMLFLRYARQPVRS